MSKEHDTLVDYDPPTSGALVAAAVVNVGAGVAAATMSDTVHVVLGSLLIAWGVFVLGWVLFYRRVSDFYDASPRIPIYDPRTSRLVLGLSAGDIGVGVVFVTLGGTAHVVLGVSLIALGAFLFSWLLFYRRRSSGTTGQ